MVGTAETSQASSMLCFWEAFSVHFLIAPWNLLIEFISCVCISFPMVNLTIVCIQLIQYYRGGTQLWEAAPP